MSTQLSTQVQTGEAVFDLIIKVAKKEKDPECAIKALEKIAAGRDGLLGTKDDALAPVVLDLLKVLLRTGVATRIVLLATQASTKCKSCGLVKAIKGFFTRRSA